MSEPLVVVGNGMAAVRFVDAIYEAGTADLLDVVRSVEPTAEAVLLIGHNAGISQFADRLADGAPVFPTGGFATLTVHRPWPELDWGAAELTSFVRPRDLDTAGA